MAILLILLLSLAVAITLKIYLKKEIGDTLIATIIFIPAILFWIHDKNISELAGFGFSAKFATETKREVSSVGGGISDLAIYSFAANDPNFRHAAFFEICAEYFVTRPSSVPEDRNELVDYIVFATHAIKSSLSCGKLVGVIVLDEKDRYLGSYDAKFFSEALALWAVPDRSEQIGKARLAERIEQTTIFGASLKFPEKRITPGEGFLAAINQEATVDAAFRRFRDSNVEFLALTDATGTFRGILTYDSIVRTLLSALIDGESKAKETR